MSELAELKTELRRSLQRERLRQMKHALDTMYEMACELSAAQDSNDPVCRIAFAMEAGAVPNLMNMYDDIVQFCGYRDLLLDPSAAYDADKLPARIEQYERDAGVTHEPA